MWFVRYFLTIYTWINRESFNIQDYVTLEQPKHTGESLSSQERVPVETQPKRTKEEKKRERKRQ